MSHNYSHQTARVYLGSYFSNTVRGLTADHLDAWSGNFCADIQSAYGASGLVGVNHPYHGQGRIRFRVDSGKKTVREYRYGPNREYVGNDLELILRMEYLGPETFGAWQQCSEVKMLHLDPDKWSIPEGQWFDWGSIGYQKNAVGQYPLYTPNGTLYSTGPHTHTATNSASGWTRDWWQQQSPYNWEWTYFKN